MTQIRNILSLYIALSAMLYATPYTNFIRQVQVPSGVQWDLSVVANGEQESHLPLDVGGARFELWSVLSQPLTTYLLDHRYVAAYAPSAEIRIVSEDPYPVVPRTRADRPFTVELLINGLTSGRNDPQAASQVKLLRHSQSYGEGGTGENIDRSQAMLVSQAMVQKNGLHKLDFSAHAIPSPNLAKATGEERLSVFSLADEYAPESQIASRHIQIWPVADGSIAGISQDQKLRFQMPLLTITLNDLYPESHTYTQVYPGEPMLGTTGTIIPGTALVINDTTPKSRVLLLDAYDAVFPTDGRWTMEILTATPFGIDRLFHVSFIIDRTIKLNGMISTID